MGLLPLCPVHLRCCSCQRPNVALGLLFLTPNTTFFNSDTGGRARSKGTLARHCAGEALRAHGGEPADTLLQRRWIAMVTGDELQRSGGWAARSPGRSAWTPALDFAWEESHIPLGPGSGVFSPAAKSKDACWLHGPGLFLPPLGCKLRYLTDKATGARHHPFPCLVYLLDQIF